MTQTVLIERDGRVAIARLNRPEALNALNAAIMHELGEKLAALDGDPGVGCIIVTGSDKAFAAGADIKEMQNKSSSEMFAEDFFSGWERVARIRTPKIAAVAGYALGGGCELALMCDTIFAADTAKFGQPEIKLGIIPGAGGTQRLPRAVGKAKAMDMVLTSRMMDAAEAERAGLVSRVVPAAELMTVVLAAAQVINELSGPAVMMAKESVNRAYESTLSEGVLFERRLFHSTFATADQKEGMDAFLNKRKPAFTQR